MKYSKIFHHDQGKEKKEDASKVFMDFLKPSIFQKCSCGSFFISQRQSSGFWRMCVTIWTSLRHAYIVLCVCHVVYISNGIFSFWLERCYSTRRELPWTSANYDIRLINIFISNCLKEASKEFQFPINCNKFCF